MSHRFVFPWVWGLMALRGVSLSGQANAPDSVRLHQLFAQHWDYTMHEYPEFATLVG